MKPLPIIFRRGIVMNVILVLLIICLFLLLFCIFMMRRNNAVFKFRTKLNHSIRPDSPTFWEDHKVMDLVSYETMLFHFWQKLGSFFQRII
jgi:hypothetical protein